MGKAQDITSIRNRGERDLIISDGAWRLLSRLCSNRFCDPKAKMDEPFALPWPRVALWCGLKTKVDCYRRISELIAEGYLKCDGLRGCPPENFFFLTLKGMQKHPIEGMQKHTTIGMQKHPHHISNSFQEEKIKGKREELAASPKGGKRLGDEKAASPQRLSPEDCAKLLANAKSAFFKDN
jgi:hypothetical protein